MLTTTDGTRLFSRHVRHGFSRRNFRDFDKILFGIPRVEDSGPRIKPVDGATNRLNTSIDKPRNNWIQIVRDEMYVVDPVGVRISLHHRIRVSHILQQFYGCRSIWRAKEDHVELYSFQAEKLV